MLPLTTQPVTLNPLLWNTPYVVSWWLVTVQASSAVMQLAVLPDGGKFEPGHAPQLAAKEMPMALFGKFQVVGSTTFGCGTGTGWSVMTNIGHAACVPCESSPTSNVTVPTRLAKSKGCFG